jgi:hypothetical protein
VPFDDLTPHHMPQAAQGFTPYREGGALVLPHAEHALTRTYAGRANRVLRSEAGMPFRQVLAKDFRDIRNLFGSKYNQGLKDVAKYYKENFGHLIGGG